MKVKNLLQSTVYAIAYRSKRENPLFAEEGIAKFHEIPTGWRYWYADPMVFSYCNKEWLFVEKMDLFRKLGTIAVAEIYGDKIGDFKEVLIERFHLSYPMVFEKDGIVYMIPESANNQTVYLYKCVDFPKNWIRVQCLFEGVRYADTTIVEKQGHWYLITGEMDPVIGSKTKTLVFNADNIEQGVLVPVFSHDTSEFVYDDRGGGNILTNNKRQIRPVQCGDENSYGRDLKFKSFVLKDDHIEQENISMITPSQIIVHPPRKVIGVHTYGVSKNLEIIDIQYKVWSHPSIIRHKICKKIKEILHK